MSQDAKQKELLFHHVVLEGSAYEVGRAQGEVCRENPGFLKFMTSPLADNPPMSKQRADETMEFFDRHCPGINEEIRGFADAVGVTPEQIVYYAFSHQSQGHCSQFAVLPEQTTDGRMVVGRSYEWDFNDDLRLVTTRVAGRAAHIGFSLLFFGRIDGLNEHGLVVTMSAGAPMVKVEEGGLRFWAVIRTLLDRCHNVDEALELLAGIPISFNLNLLLADKTGQAALVEIACSKRAVKRIHPGCGEPVLIATNHYNHPDMLPYDLGRMWQSVARYKALESALCTSTPVGKEDIRRVLSSSVPEGVCCHYYEDGLGTLWSVIYDVAAGEAEIALGSPQRNPWRKFGLHDPVGVTPHPAIFPLEQPADPAAFYRRLSPGVNEKLSLYQR